MADNVRSPARSVANNEFHHAGDEVDDVAREITAALERLGIRSLNPPKPFIGMTNTTEDGKTVHRLISG